MTFLTPEALWLLVALPALIALYVVLLRRRKHFPVRYSNLALVKDALGPEQHIRRHIPPALLLIGLGVAIFAAARPTTVITLPSEQRTIVMAIDVSLSMRATDVQPNRLVAAQAAAKGFVQQQPNDVRLGIVTFAGSAQLVQKPTRNKEDLVAAIDRFELQRHTAIGSGILVSLAALFPDDDIDVEKAVLGGVSTRERIKKQDAKAERKPEPKAVPPGSHASGAIILLTDGRRTTGPDPLQVASLAANRGVRVFTVGFGKAGGGPANIDGYSMFMAFDEDTLKSIAEITRAEYFHAPNSDELVKVYQALTARFQLERSTTEVTALAAAAAATLMAAAAALSIVWFGRVA
ncbi:MAG TPA: VWA domain-containing protein [Casimicrobiaceae bacterium]|nr:VWA domain-containing protein [Casimicrobiaceae bacterium]